MQNLVHVSACLVTAVVMHFVALNGFGLSCLAAMIGGLVVTLGVRGLAIRLGWSLPVFRGLATRERWKNARKDQGQG